MRDISVFFGPGQHQEEIEKFLLEAGVFRQKLVMYPKLSSTLYGSRSGPVKRLFPFFSAFEHFAWGVWTNLPVLKKFKTPESVTFALADWLLSRQLVRSRVFIGWGMVSLYCMRRARSQGSRVYLEHPMAHVDEWMEIVRSEYGAWDNDSGYHGLIPQSVVRRTRIECEEAETIIVHSSFAKNSFLKRGTPEEKLIVTPLGIDHKLFSPKVHYSEKGPLKILFVGRVELLKGVQYLLEALSTLPKDEVELHLVGRVTPEFEPMLKRHRDLPLVVNGPVAREQLPVVYRNADLFVFPSVNDAFGMVILEAMSSGLPVITTENSCGPDVITEGEDGFIVAIRDPHALADRIRYFIEDRSRLQEMGVRAREKVTNGFTSEHYRQRLRSVYMADPIS